MHLTRFFRLFFFCLAFSVYFAGCSDTPTGRNGGSNGGGGGNGNGYDHRRAPGETSADFLRDETYQHLRVEIDYVESQHPTGQALDSLQQMLENRLHKSGGITISVSAEPFGSGGQQTYTASEIRSLEDEHRDLYTHGDTLAAYFIYLDGQYEQENVLGLAYYNTSMAIMEETIREHSGGIGNPPRYKIEATVLNHEFGHILGLVANGTPMQNDHKTDGSEHCTAENCLMRPAVNTSDFFANVFEGSIPDFDPQCLNDLQGHGGK